jgi:hypothetical protein
MHPFGTLAKRLVITLALAGSSQILADEGRIPLFKPTVISQPGHYILIKDITYTAGSIFDITTGNVTLDLNGRTLTGGSSFPIIRFLPGPTGSVSIRNGRLVGSGIATDFFAAPRTVRFENLDLNNGSINFTLSDPGFDPIVDVVGCRLVNGGITAIHDPGSVVAHIVDNSIQGGDIYLQHSRNSVIAGNSVRNGNIEVAGGLGGNQVRENSVSGGGPFGIAVKTYSFDANSGNSSVVGNVVANSGTGIWVSANYARVAENVTSQNSSDGIAITDSVGNLTLGVHLENNQSNGNGGCGIRFTSETGHTFRGNNVRDNGVSGIAGACGGDLGTNLDAGGNIL